ncbi:DUF6262 family protein [Spongiactinospora rosea]|uniref:DUF6262 family protein n=1 Tax=Spongiactinospora rosea TaxID=2248750 RepID=UPI0018F569F4|nr:DUF6262 family protein [Spongiactinospora rosea]
MPADNSHHLIEAARQRHLACIARVHHILDNLERNGGKITVAGVAAQAGVSRTFLYHPDQADLLKRLRDLAEQQPSAGRPAAPIRQRLSTRSHETIVKALRKANQTLREENQRLHNELAVALGQLRDYRRGMQNPTSPQTQPFVADTVSHTNSQVKGQS